MPPDTCPSCGAPVPANARACPACGADEHTGWSDRAQAGRLGIPDDEFDYDAFVREEFGPEPRRPTRRLHWLWWVAAILVLLAFVFVYLR